MAAGCSASAEAEPDNSWSGVLKCSVQGVTISNDGATLLKLLDVVHPAAKILVDISTSQDAEVPRHCSALTCSLNLSEHRTMPGV